MALVVFLVGALAHWDGQREATLALDEFATEQASLAAAVSAELATRLKQGRRDAWLVADGAADPTRPRALANDYLATRVVAAGSAAPSTTAHATLRVPLGGRTVELDISPRALIEVASSAEVSGQRRLFLFTPDSGTVAFGLDGRTVEVPSLAATLSRGGGTVRLSRAEAAAVGLPSRTALAGIAAVETGDLGRWGVAVVSSAASERDRDIRASWRLALSVLFAGGIVLAFGAFALRRQREQLVVEQELALAQLDRDRSERLVRASRAATMGTFAMGIAHEISTPLGVISGRTEQLLSRTDDPRSRRGLTAIGEQVEQIGGVVRSFLDLARGGAPTIATVDPRVLVEGSVRLVEFRFASSGVHLAIDLPPGVPPIHCDLRLVEHALVNLLLNACEACEMGGHVELAVRAAAGTIAFVVTDDGKGISPEEAARATEPFFTTKAHGDGAGLGLAIVQEIAKSHRGSLSIGPRASKGTRAALQLPIEQDHG